MNGGPVTLPVIDLPSLQGVSQTLLMTLHARSQASQHPGLDIRDLRSVEIAARLNVDLSRFRVSRLTAVCILMRQRKIDAMVSAFLTGHPDARVFHIGCGLDFRFERLDNDHVEWFDVDLPDVIALRHQLFPPSNGRYHSLANSALEPGWINRVEHLAARPHLFIIEGLLPYLTEAQVKALVLELKQRFEGSHLICDYHTFVGNQFVNLQLALTDIEARAHWYVHKPSDLEGWAEGIRLLEEWCYPDDEQPPHRLLRQIRPIKLLARSSGILHCRLGTASAG